MTSPFNISSVRDDIFVMLGVLLRNLVAAGRGQDLSAVGDLVWSVPLVWAVLLVWVVLLVWAS